MKYPPQGTRELWLNHDHSDWSTNAHVYRFAPVVSHYVRVVAVKHPNQTLEVEADGPMGRRFQFRFHMPACDSRGLHLVIAWECNQIQFFLNTNLAESFTVP